MIAWLYEQGWANVIYYGFHVLGFLAVITFNVWYGKKYGIKAKEALITTGIVYPVAYLWIYVLCWAESGFQNFGGNNIVRGFIYFPLIAWPVARLLKIRWGKICDFIAPCICLCHGVSHIGCIFIGCCEGYACTFGIYNPAHEAVLFPVQIFEALTALAIVAFLVWRASRNGYQADGTAYPIMLILFGSTRFLWEFARDNEKLWLGCSALAFHALFMALVGLDLYGTIREKRKKNAQKLERHIHNPKKSGGKKR